MCRNQRTNVAHVPSGNVMHVTHSHVTTCQVQQLENDDIGHTKHHIGHSIYRPNVDIGHTISATKRVTFSSLSKPGRLVRSGVARIWCGGWV